MTEEEEMDQVNEVLDVSHVYLLMKKEYRMSRNSRAKWYFQYLDKTIKYTPVSDLSTKTGGLDVISVVPENCHTCLSPDHVYDCRMSPSTIVSFIARNYRLVFTLDLSPSAVAVDINKSKVIVDDVFLALKNCITGLSKSFYIPGSENLLSPQLFVSVIAYTPLIDCQAFQVLSQGCLVTEVSAPHFLSHVRAQLTKFENTVAMATGSLDPGLHQGGVTFDDIMEPEEDLPATPAMTPPDLVFMNMLKNSMLALSVLPENSTAGIVIISDGILGIPDSGMFDSILTQLRVSSTAVSFVRVGSGYHPNTTYGHVPNIELMQFFATATFGAYLPSTPMISDDSRALNMYHKALLLWNFQKGLDEFHCDNFQFVFTMLDEEFSWISKQISTLLPDKQIWASPVLRKKHLEENIHASIASVMSVRLREGYTIKHVSITKGGNQIEVKLVLPWRHGINIEYVAVSSWPLSSSVLQTHIEVYSEGGYEFLHDVTCPRKQPFKSPYRGAMVKRFWMALQGLSQTDRFLQHLESFSSNPVYYTIPESVRSGVPLFYIPPNSTSPVLSLQQSSRDSVLAQFATFWRRIVNLDPNVWQKWMHSHRIGLVLEHDRPPPKYLHIPSASGRFSVIQCRQALTSLNVLLKNFSTFVLLENQSYIKLFFSEPDKPPTSFYLMRVASKPPCVVLRVAFLGGTPEHERNKIVNQLKGLLADLNFPQRGTQNKGRRRTAIVEAEPGTWRAPLQRDWSEIKCCILLAKPVEKILLRYERLPRNFLQLELPSREELFHSAADTSKPLSSVFNTLSRYLYHQRWVWSFNNGSVGHSSLPALGKILSTIAKLRLQEGFHYADTSLGITNMFLEVQMGIPSDTDCPKSASNYELYQSVVQYILFPPQMSTTKESVSEDDGDEESTEADGELQLITECWVEPQGGVLVGSNRNQRHLEGLDYTQLARAFLPRDSDCISTMLVFEHLSLMCQEELIVPSPQLNEPPSLVPQPVTPRNTPTLDEMIAARKKAQQDSTPSSVQYIPYSFDLMKLLPKSQQVQLLFSSFIQEQEGPSDVKSSNKILFDLLSESLHSVHNRELTLSTKETMSFMEMINSRHQGGYCEQSTASRQTSEETLRQMSVDTSANSPSASASQPVNWTQSNSPSVLPQAEDLSSSMNSLNASRLRYDIANLKLGHCLPRWKCFVKSLSAIDAIVTIMPASYDDLTLLAETTHQVSPVSSQKASESGNAVSHSGMKSDEALTSKIEADLERPGTSQKNQPTDHPDTEQDANDSSADQETYRSPERGCFTLPIYVYHCCLSHITGSFIYEHTYQHPNDIVKDYTFGVESAEFQEDTQRLSVSETESMFTGFERRRSTFERSISVDQLSDKSYLNGHCSLVSDMYLKCFVKGVYKSLQLGNPVHFLDVDSAINNICEESRPIEVSASNFLCTVCRHLQKVIERRKVAELAEQADKEEEEDDGIVFSELDPKTLMKKEEEEAKKKQMILFPLSSLAKYRNCLSSDSRHIKKKFNDVIGKFFKPIPSNPKYYFYCPPTFRHRMSTSQQTETEDQAGDLSTGREGEESDMFVSDYEDTKPSSHDKDSVHSNFGSSESRSSSFGDLSFAVDSEDSEDQPLFIHLSCTVRTKTFNTHSLAVQSLPTCIGELASIIRDPEIDLNDLVVTLDIICLTLPMDSEVAKPNFDRLLSFDVDDVEMGLTSDRTDYDDVYSTYSGVTSDGGFLAGDPLNNIPEFQQKAVLTCKDEIYWLLTDERASALRNTAPITTETLNFVATHVKDVQKRDTCIYEQLPLHFVYGPEQSMDKFVEEFERMNVPGYHVNREGDYYFLVADRVRSNTLLAVTSRLELLTDQQSPDKTSEACHHEYEGDVFNTTNSFTQIEEELGGDDDQQMAPVDTRADKIKISLVEPTPDRDQCQSVYADGGYNDRSSGSSIQILDESESLDKLAVQDLPVDVHPSVSEVLQAASQSLVAESQKNIKRVKSETVFLSRLRPGSAGSEDGAAVTAVAPSTHDNVAQEGVHDLSSLSSLNARRVQIKKAASTESLPSTRAVGEDLLPLKSILRHKRYSSTPQTPVTCASLRGTPIAPRSRHSSGPTTTAGTQPGGVRSRNVSGPVGNMERKLSSVFSSSRGSCTGEVSGYEGDSSGNSESEETNPLTDMSSNYTVKRPLLPDFWLIMRLQNDVVEVFFHTRENENDSERLHELMKVYAKVLTNIKHTCQVVNQHLLLQELNETRMCNKLLVPEADEDIWQQEELDVAMNRRRNSNVSAISGFTSDSEDERETYMEANLHFEPGHFACDLMWKENFMLHPRLKTGPGRTGVSRGMTALRTVLNTFSVNNRKHMFVIRQTTGEVFYLRLSDYTSGHSNLTVSLSDSASHSRLAADEEFSPSNSLNTSVWSLHTKDEASDTGRPVLDSTESSVNRLRSGVSRHSSVASGRRVDDCIEMTVYGITKVGTEITEDLTQALQKRLDDAVLDMITVHLARNPMCKLTPEDVQFIQPPLEMPKRVVHFSLPDDPGLPLCAVNYYLRQNLLQVLFSPKYADVKDRGECHFQDYTQSPPKPFPENESFLFNRPHASGGKGVGIAVVHMTMVNCQGLPMQLNVGLKPLQEAHRPKYSVEIFEQLVRVQEMSSFPVESQTGHGFIQFHIWERGDVDMTSLIDHHLRPAIRNALCDVIMEYQLLTAPLCSMPPDLTSDLVESKSPAQIEKEAVDKNAQKKTKSEEKATLTRKSSSPFPLNFFGRMKNPTSPTVKNEKSFFGEGFPHSESESTLNRALDKPPSPRELCERGELGTLLPLYYSSILQWFDFVAAQDGPSVFQMTTGLLSRMSVSLVLKEIKALVLRQCSDTLTPMFVKNKSGEYTACETQREPLSTNDTAETSLDVNKSSSHLLPGQSSSYILVGRNVDQWQACIDRRDKTEEEACVEPPSLVNPSTRKNFQKFVPLEPSISRDSSVSKSIFVPRQRIFILMVDDRKLTLYVYNWAQDLVRTLEHQLKSLIQWHNARGHLLANIVSQKMGLFRHHYFDKMPPEPHSKEANPFNQSTNELDALIRSSVPPQKDPLPQTRSRVGSITGIAPPTGSGLPIQDLYKDCKVIRPMCRAAYSHFKDLVARHGMQLLDIRKHQWREKEIKRKLHFLYDTWQQRVGSSNIPISEDMVHLLKHLSRLMHNIATPLLFSPVWRRRVFDSPECPDLAEEGPITAEPVKSRSRHGSGASVKSKKSDESRLRVQSNDSGTYVESVWHADLRTSFVDQYIQYLQELGFVQIQIRPQSPKRSYRPPRSKVLEEVKGANPMVRSPVIFNLQKTIPGGIILVELTFLEVFFDIKIYAFDVSRISPYRNRASQPFADECDKFKELTHVHSFAHDFHLRSIQRYLDGQQMILKRGYHLSNFLGDFVKFYPYAPSFARNHLFEGTLIFKDDNLMGPQLFDYMLQKDKVYHMKTVRMMLHNRDSDNSENEYALVSQYSCSGIDIIEGSNIQDDYDVGLVIVHDTSYPDDIQEKILRLKYYIVFTSRRVLFPKLNLDKKLPFQRPAPSSVKQYSASPHGLESRLDGVYLGQQPSSVIQQINSHHLVDTSESGAGLHSQITPAMKALLHEAKLVKDKIESMVENAKSQCRRDSLWQRMLLGNSVEEDRKKRRSDTEDSRDLLFLTNGKLTFKEFKELLTVVKRVPLSAIDGQLCPFMNMSIAWYKELVRVLIHKYTETHRHYVSTDGREEYVAVLNPNYLDAFILLKVDTNNMKADLCAMYRECVPREEHTPTTPSLPAYAMQNHLQGFVNACSYNLWCSIIQ